MMFGIAAIANMPTGQLTDQIVLNQQAADAGLKTGTEYSFGDPFNVQGGSLSSVQPGPIKVTTLYTARLIGDPVVLTRRVIDAIGFVTKTGNRRWLYISMPHFIWLELPSVLQRDVIGWMYQREGVCC